ncbi:MAG: purine-nucleoside phosphorylase [Erysipelotrichaceae bacterium]|nr:purine-nucleoside phosphorylase [Erysipelotrichaceae bacterium]
MSTPHNEAVLGDFAKVVLMPGDPLRAKYIADNFLEDVRQVTGVRNMLGFTGTYKGHKVSVMGSGMGMPSIGIYSWELFNFYDVDTIIRIGSAGSYTADLKVRDVFLGTAAYSLSSFPKQMDGLSEPKLTYPSAKVNEVIRATADEIGVHLSEGVIHSSDVFYTQSELPLEEVRKYECKCAEMESFALFFNAAKCNKNAACLLTISDSLVTEEAISAEERQTSFVNMMKVALESAIKLGE